MEKINDLTFSGHLGKSSSGEQHRVQELVGAVELHFSYHSTVETAVSVRCCFPGPPPGAPVD